MKPVVPFLSTADGTGRKIWMDALPPALKDTAEIKAFEDLNADERAAAKVAIVANPDPAKVAALQNLVWVQSLWAGVERLVAELPEEGPLIVRLVDPQLADTMSEAVLAWTLYLHRDMPRYARQQRAKIWEEHLLKRPQERTVGVLGLGSLGAKSALRLQENGFPVIGWSRSEKKLKGIDCFSGTDGFKTVLQQSDIVVLLMPLTQDTRGMINRETLSVMKPGAQIINFARGPIIVEEDLLTALTDGQVRHAVLDVFDTEPLAPGHPFWEHDNITVLPHISAPTMTETACAIAANNIKTYFETGEIPETIDRTRGY